ncbi:MAG TPA: hypothetical protein VFY18_11685, partial [Candidatus Limnocylindrales bacterium]|nr:hypothetical protein [Candidatus Limnocylindrales bacterium]
MAEGIVYLDVDDEITSAASRIRSAPGTKVALVIPNGSRIATSRINFRLLSREALVSNRRLSVIAGDPASRALAASAGLPVFATVSEYEAALAGPKPGVDDERGPAIVAGIDPHSAPTPEPSRSRKRAADVPAGIAAAGAAAGAADAGTAAVTPTVPDETRRMAAPVAAPPRFDRPRGPEGRDMIPVAAGRGRVRWAVVATIAAVALAVVMVGVAGYLFLPSATIALTPRQESIEIPLTIAADPTATEVDAANSIVPALRLEVPVQASKTFTTTGTHVELSQADGSVIFTNYN